MTPQERLAILLAAAEALRAKPFRVEAEGCGCCYNAEPRTFTHEGRVFSAGFGYDNRTGDSYATVQGARPHGQRGVDFVGSLSVGSDGRALAVCHMPLPLS